MDSTTGESSKTPSAESNTRALNVEYSAQSINTLPLEKRIEELERRTKELAKEVFSWEEMKNWLPLLPLHVDDVGALEKRVSALEKKYSDWKTRFPVLSKKSGPDEQQARMDAHRTSENSIMNISCSS